MLSSYLVIILTFRFYLRKIADKVGFKCNKCGSYYSLHNQNEQHQLLCNKCDKAELKALRKPQFFKTPIKHQIIQLIGLILFTISFSVLSIALSQITTFLIERLKWIEFLDDGSISGMMLMMGTIMIPVFLFTLFPAFYISLICVIIPYSVHFNIKIPVDPSSFNGSWSYNYTLRVKKYFEDNYGFGDDKSIEVESPVSR